MVNVLALIPARSGSKGVPDKNILELGNHSLLDWSISLCRKSKLIDRIVVSTDSEDYAEKARNLGAECPFLRPSLISQDHSTDLEFINHAISWLDANGECPDFIAHIRPTTPLREPEIVDKAIHEFMSNEKATSLRSVHEMSESAYKCFEIGKDGLLKSFFVGNKNLDRANLARQTFKKTFVANGYIDVLKTSFIREKNVLHGSCVIPFITDQAIEIDSYLDFKFLEFELSQNKKNFKSIFV